MNNKLNDLFAMVLPVLTLIVTIFSENLHPLLKILLPIGIAVFVIIYIVWSNLHRNNNLSNTNVIFKSKKYTKYLKRIIKTNAKVLSKDFNLTELAQTKKEIDLLTKKINRSYKKNKSDEIQKYVDLRHKLLDKHYDKSHEYADTNVLKANTPINEIIKLANYQESKRVFNLVYDAIHGMERIILQLEQHDLRILLGKYVVKYSTDIDKTIHAYVDYLGWTYILLGKNSKGFEAIQNGLNLIDYKINISKAGHNEYCELKSKGEEIPDSIKKQHVDYCEYTLQKARALRHLGTTYYTYRSYKDNFVKENLTKKSEWNFKNTTNPFVKQKIMQGLQLMNEQSVIDYFMETPKKQEKYFKMVFGLQYNDLLYDYYVALYKNDQSVQTYIALDDKLNELIADIDKCDFSDNHRLIKILTLQNQLKHRLYNLQDEANITISGSNDWDELLGRDLKTIESVLNQNIYFDEAMEVYVCQKVRKLYEDIEGVFNTNKK